jgi:riboflavin biosynthesis pyrimidine reductase
MERRQPGASSEQYLLTQKGLELKPVIIALTEWGDRWVRPGPFVFRNGSDGQPVELQLRRIGDDTQVAIADVVARREQRWTAVQNAPDKPRPTTGKLPTPAEVEWARFAAQTPHYVLSTTLTSALWPQTSFVRGHEDIAALKRQPGKDIYLMGGARITARLIDAGLVDELRLIVHPLIAGEGKALFATTERRRGLELQEVQQLQGGRISLIYGID